MTKQLRRVTSSDITKSPFYKNSLGFESIFDELLNSANNATGGYPPCNLYRTTKGDNVTYEVVLAVAGFSKDDLDITVENNKLHISGQATMLDERFGDAEVEHLHKGIAERSFTRSFKLAEHLEIQGATLDDGILIVTLKQVVPEELKPKRIEIK
jgi:molecular chaperone IbpA